MTTKAKKEQNLLDKASREFASKMLAPEREENDKYPFGPFFDNVLDKAFELDLFHVLLPEEIGGIGYNIDSLCVVLANICQEDSSLGGIIFTNTLAQTLMMTAGDYEALGEITKSSENVKDFLIAYPSMINPSEVKFLPQTQKTNGNYMITGSLDYLVLGSIAGHALIPARVEGKDTYSFFLVKMDDKDIVAGEPVVSHGLHACPAVDVSFKGAKGVLVGAQDEGQAYFDQSAVFMQLAAASMAYGIMKGSLKESIDYCKKRSQGGRKIIDWSALQMILADMVIQTNVAEMLVKQACQQAETKEKNWELMVKSAATHIQTAAASLVSDGIQTMGGVGYMKDFGQEKRFRDVGHVNAFLGLAPMKKLRLLRELVA